MIPDGDALFKAIAKRYGRIEPEALKRVLCPVLIPMYSLDKTIVKAPGQKHLHASFSIRIDSTNQELMQPGRTGKFVPKSYVEGGAWREIAKGRILAVDQAAGIANGEIYVGASQKGALQLALDDLSAADYLEIDQYGAAAKVLSGLVEYTLAQEVVTQGYVVRRMPEDIARHVGAYYYCDFLLLRLRV